MNEFEVSFENIEIESEKNFESLKKELFEFKINSPTEIIFHPKENIYIKNLSLIYSLKKPKNFLIFRNGFQSWSPSYFFKNEIKEKTPILKILKYHYLDPENLSPNYSFNFIVLKGDYNYLYLINDNSDFFVYFVLYKDKLKVTFEIDKLLKEPIILKIKIFEVKKPIFEQNFNKKIYGWTSWYYYYRNINKDEIFKNIEAIDRIPFKINYFQIDDGWQESIGDWKENEKFKGSLEEISHKLIEKNILPGIWLAPFIVEKNSSIFKRRKDLLLKNKRGEIFPCGYNPLWSGYFYPLNIENEEVKDKILNILHNLREIGFRLFKLDFLYAGFIKGETKISRYEKFINFMKDIREVLKDSIILGCGAPYILKEGVFDILRIGPDTMDGWKNSLLRLLGFEGRVEAYNSLRNTLLRNIFSPQKFLFDPDVIFLKPKKLNDFEKETIILVNYLLSNFIFFSDPIYNLNSDDFILIEKLREIGSYFIYDFYFEDELYKYSFKGENFNFSLFVNLSDKVKKVEKGKDELIKKRDDNLIYPHESRIFII
ncbi:MAG: alpha-galactosidase [Caldisericia bacterium]|nr:alpha-galactosidase [Caldisericia bacterium]